MELIKMNLSVQQDESTKAYAVYSGETCLGSYGSLAEATGVFQAFAEKLKVSKGIAERVIAELRTAWDLSESGNDSGGNNAPVSPSRSGMSR